MCAKSALIVGKVLLYILHDKCVRRITSLYL